MDFFFISLKALFWAILYFLSQPHDQISLKSCPWILVVDPYQMFNIVHVHNSKRKAVGNRGHCAKKMRSDIVHSVFAISIKPASVDCSTDQAKTKGDNFRLDISVYSSVNPCTGSSSNSSSSSSVTKALWLFCVRIGSCSRQKRRGKENYRYTVQKSFYCITQSSSRSLQFSVFYFLLYSLTHTLTTFYLLLP